MGQDLPPTGGYEPIQYKVSSSNAIFLHPRISRLLTLSAQHPRARFPSIVLPPRHQRYMWVRTVQDWEGHQRTEVCLTDLIHPPDTTNGSQCPPSKENPQDLSPAPAPNLLQQDPIAQSIRGS